MAYVSYFYFFAKNYFYCQFYSKYLNFTYYIYQTIYYKNIINKHYIKENNKLNTHKLNTKFNDFSKMKIIIHLWIYPIINASLAMYLIIFKLDLFFDQDSFLILVRLSSLAIKTYEMGILYCFKGFFIKFHFILSF